MILRFILFLSRKYQEYKDLSLPGIRPRSDWKYDKCGDMRREI